jgi:hypothetical protein
MKESKQAENSGIFLKATPKQRSKAGFVLAGIVLFFAFAGLAGAKVIDLDKLFGPCGFKQRYNLPCPTCGMTTSAVEFAKGNVFNAVYIQPAAGVLCWFAVIAAVLAFITIVFGLYFRFISLLIETLKIKYTILVLLIVIAGGWAVTLARAISGN